MAILERVVVVTVLTVGLCFQAVAESYDYADVKYDEQSAMGDMRADVTIANPINLDGNRLGLTALVNTLSFFVSSESEDEIDVVSVSAPLNYTFMRPLGGFESGARAEYAHDAVPAE